MSNARQNRPETASPSQSGTLECSTPKRAGRPPKYDWDSVDWDADPFDAKAIAKRFGCRLCLVYQTWHRRNKGRVMPSRSALKDWRYWDMPIAQIAQAVGVSKQAVQQYRDRMLRREKAMLSTKSNTLE
jgi:hypothetical protein